MRSPSGDSMQLAARGRRAAVGARSQSVTAPERAAEVRVVGKAVACGDLANCHVGESGLNEVAMASLKSPRENPTSEAGATIGEQSV